LSFRPVKEVWGEHSSCFVDAGLMLRVLLAIAVEAGSHGEAHEYGDKTSIWVEEGANSLTLSAMNASSPQSASRALSG